METKKEEPQDLTETGGLPGPGAQQPSQGQASFSEKDDQGWFSEHLVRSPCSPAIFWL